MKHKLYMWIVWHLPPQILLLAVVRGFADATSGKWGNEFFGDVGYKEVYDRIVEKYQIRDEQI